MESCQHPFQTGQVFSSPGGHFTYRVIGPCCRLFDREELPYPCCRLEWRGKEPSWRRIGKRFVADLSSRNSPSYCVQILEHHSLSEPFVMTMYWVKLPQSVKDWWYCRRVELSQSSSPEAPIASPNSDSTTLLVTSPKI